MLAWVVIVVNAIVLFYVCIFPGFSVADQAANPPNTKGMFTFDGNSFLTFTLPNYEIYSSFWKIFRTYSQINLTHPSQLP